CGADEGVPAHPEPPAGMEETVGTRTSEWGREPPSGRAGWHTSPSAPGTAALSLEPPQPPGSRNMIHATMKTVPRSICISSMGLLALVVVSCTHEGETRREPGEEAPHMALLVTSTAFTEAQTIPEKHTCDGADVSAPLSWTGVPQNARSLALICDDPDAPAGTWVHWVLYGL